MRRAREFYDPSINATILMDDELIQEKYYNILIVVVQRIL